MYYFISYTLYIFNTSSRYKQSSIPQFAIVASDGLFWLNIVTSSQLMCDVTRTRATSIVTSVRLQNLPWYKTRFCIDPFWDKSSFVASIEDAKPVLILNRFCNLPHPNRLCACSKTGFLPTLNQPLQNRLCACSKTGFVPTLNQPLQNRLCACSKTGFVPTLNQPPQNGLCAYSKTGFVPTLNQLLQNRLSACSKTSVVPSLNLLHQNRLCANAQPAAPKQDFHWH